MSTDAQQALQQLSLTLSRSDGAAAQPRAPTASPSCSRRSLSLAASPDRPASRRPGRPAQNGSTAERRRGGWERPSRVAPSTLRFLKQWAPSILVTRAHSASEAASKALVGSLIESAIASDAALSALLEEAGEEATPRPSSRAPTRRSSLFAHGAAAGLRLSGSAEVQEGSYTATEAARARLSAEQLDRPWEVPGVVAALLALMDDEHSPLVLRCAAAANPNPNPNRNRNPSPNPNPNPNPDPNANQVLRCAAAAALQTIAAGEAGGAAVLSAGGAQPLRHALTAHRHNEDASLCTCAPRYAPRCAAPPGEDYPDPDPNPNLDPNPYLATRLAAQLHQLAAHLHLVRVRVSLILTLT